MTVVSVPQFLVNELGQIYSAFEQIVVHGFQRFLDLDLISCHFCFWFICFKFIFFLFTRLGIRVFLFFFLYYISYLK